MRVVLEQMEPVGTVDRAARMSNSLTPSESELQAEIGTLPVTPAPKCHPSTVRRSKRDESDGERDGFRGEQNKQSADDSKGQNLAFDSDTQSKSEEPSIDIQVQSEEEETRDDSGKACCTVLNVRS